ncbi:MAG: hypothetical protein JWP87_2830 [Labilithrix sp.]|nr:hypothetical protein [Labilithrix sp.]
MRARTAAVIGVAAAVAVAAVAVARRHAPADTRAVATTTAIRLVRRDRVGLPEKKGLVRDPAHVRTLTEALGVDVHPAGECPPDYADADIGIVLSGNDVYARRNVYLFGLLGDGGAPSVVSATSAGCRLGPPADLASLRRELRMAGIVE